MIALSCVLAALAFSFAVLFWRTFLIARRLMSDPNSVEHYREINRAQLRSIDNAQQEASCLRVALVLSVGYLNRLESDLRALGNSARTREIIDSAPPILPMIDAINRREWSKFRAIAAGTWGKRG